MNTAIIPNSDTSNPQTFSDYLDATFDPGISTEERYYVNAFIFEIILKHTPHGIYVRDIEQNHWNTFVMFLLLKHGEEL